MLMSFFLNIFSNSDSFKLVDYLIKILFVRERKWRGWEYVKEAQGMSNGWQGFVIMLSWSARFYFPAAQECSLQSGSKFVGWLRNPIREWGQSRLGLFDNDNDDGARTRRYETWLRQHRYIERRNITMSRLYGNCRTWASSRESPKHLSEEASFRKNVWNTFVLSPWYVVTIVFRMQLNFLSERIKTSLESKSMKLPNFQFP